MGVGISYFFRTKSRAGLYTNMNNAVEETVSESPEVLLAQHEKRIRVQARKFAKAYYDDLIQEGRIAFIAAVPLWRGDNGAALWTFASRLVFQAMLRFVNANPTKETVSLGDLPEEESLEASPEAVLELAQCKSIMIDQFSALSEQDRRVLRLRYTDGYGVRDIADILSIPKSTAHEMIQSAIGNLRQRMGALL